MSSSREASVCRYYLRGECHFGEYCPFSHDENDIFDESDGNYNDVGDDIGDNADSDNQSSSNGIGASQPLIHCGICELTHPRRECLEVCFVTRSDTGHLCMYIRSGPKRPNPTISYVTITNPVFSSSLLQQLVQEEQDAGGDRSGFFDKVAKNERAHFEEENAKRTAELRVQEEAETSALQREQQQRLDERRRVELLLELQKERQQRQLLEARVQQLELLLRQVNLNNTPQEQTRLDRASEVGHPFYCHLCHITATSMDSLRQHIMGKKHAFYVAKSNEEPNNRNQQIPSITSTTTTNSSSSSSADAQSRSSQGICFPSSSTLTPSAPTQVRVVVPDYFCCPITLTIMEDPVIAITSGESFERRALLRWISQHGTDPVTRQPLGTTSLASNRKLKEAIDKWKLKHPFYCG